MCAVTVGLYHQEISNHPERVYNIKTFSKKYDWKGIRFQFDSKYWEIFERNISTIALNIVHLDEKEKME